MRIRKTILSTWDCSLDDNGTAFFEFFTSSAREFFYIVCVPFLNTTLSKWRWLRFCHLRHCICICFCFIGRLFGIYTNLGLCKQNSVPFLPPSVSLLTQVVQPVLKRHSQRLLHNSLEPFFPTQSCQMQLLLSFLIRIRRWHLWPQNGLQKSLFRLIPQLDPWQ